MSTPDLWTAVGRSILEVEGGYVNHPNDPGGETKYGISKRAYPNLDIRNLTPEAALAIYRRDYWDKLPPGLEPAARWFLFDCAVNHGVSRASTWHRQVETLEELVAVRLNFFANLETFATFGKGWTRRVARVLMHIDDWRREASPTTPVTVLVLHGLTMADRMAMTQPEPVLRGQFATRFSPHATGRRLDVRREG